jgi:hypothetical protein
METKSLTLQQAPRSASDLRTHTKTVMEAFGLDSSCKGQSYTKSDDLKVNPGKYGSTVVYDFGLCWATFFTKEQYGTGAKCPWRHHRLRAGERGFIRDLGAEKALDWMRECYDSPKVPLITPWFPSTTQGHKE